MKSVLFIRANPVRPDSRVEKEVEALHKQGYCVSVLAWDRSDDYPIRREPLNDVLSDVPAYRVGIKASYGSGIKNLKYLARFQREIRRFLKVNTFDIIHACDFDTAFTAYRCVKRKPTKFVYDIFDYYADAFSIPSILRKPVVVFDKRIINGADLTIICSEKRKEQIAGSKPKKLLVIHNSPPEVQVEEKATEANETGIIRIAYFGILSANRLIKEMLEVVSENAQFELHIGGFGVLEKIVQEMAEKNENVYYYGTVPYQKVLEIENNCNVLTAIYDPSVRNHLYAAPNKFYEALMLGKPVIMVKKTGMSEIVERNSIGVTIDFSKEGFYKGITELANKRNEWTLMAGKMKKLYSGEYSWEEMECRLISAYKEL